MVCLSKLQAKTDLQCCMVGKGLNTFTNVQVRCMLNEHHFKKRPVHYIGYSKEG